jgi:tetratricopeptide (TPR) repeat protein
MSKTINSALKYLIIAGLVIVPFIPLYVANSMFFPFITGKAFVFRIIVEIVFALWLILVLRERGNIEDSSRSVIPRVNSLTIFVTAFVLFMLVADLLGLNPIRSIWSNFERMEGWMTLIHLWAYFMVLSSIFRTKEQWNKYFNVVLLSGFIAALYGLFQFFGWAAIHQGSSRVDASLGNSAYMAVYMLLNAFLAVYMAFSEKRYKAATWIYGILGAIFSFVMFQTATRGTILGWLLAILVSSTIYAIYEKENRRGKKIGAGILVAVIALITIFYFVKDASWIQKNEVLGRLATISITDTKTQARGFIWPMALQGVFENPKSMVLGIGQENFNYIFNKHYNPKMWAHEQWFDRAHSVFIDWLVAGGVLGLALYLSLYILSLVYIAKSNLSVGEKSILVGLLVGYAIHNIFVFDNQTSYVMFFTILAYVHSFRPGKVYGALGGSTKPLTSDGEVVRDYVFVPIIVILFFITLYFVSIRPIQSNLRLITALRACTKAEGLSAKVFEDALKLDQTVANQETREQYFSCAASVIQSSLPEQTKLEFYNLAKKVTDDQIKDTPNDARGYIIAGGFYNSIGDAQTALPLLEKAHELSPAKQSITYELASNYITQGKTEEALKILEEAYLSAKENGTAKIAYIVGLISAGQEAKARELFKEEPDLFLDQRIISSYVYSKQYAKAIELQKQLIQKNPNDQGAYSSLASIYLMNKEKTKAIETLRTAESKFPELKTQVENIIKQIEEGKVTF